MQRDRVMSEALARIARGIHSTMGEGTVTQVMGPVVDVHFIGDLPAIGNLLRVNDAETGLPLEAAQLARRRHRARDRAGLDRRARPRVPRVRPRPAHHGAGRPGDPRPDVQRARRADRREGAHPGPQPSVHTETAPRVRARPQLSRGLRDRPQGHRPADPVPARRQDRAVRWRGRGQDRRHHGAHPQRRRGAQGRAQCSAGSASARARATTCGAR